MGSKSSPSSKGCTMDNQGKEYVRNAIKNHIMPKKNDGKEIPCPYKDRIYITDVWWNYKSAGKNNFHRFLEFRFICNYCGFSKYVRMDKVDDGTKNICCKDGLFNQSGLWYWHYNPKNNYYDIDDLIKLFDNAPRGYNLLTNNCKHFAQYFWDNIKDCNGN